MDTPNGDGVEALVSFDERTMAAFEQDKEILAFTTSLHTEPVWLTPIFQTRFCRYYPGDGQIGVPCDGCRHGFELRYKQHEGLNELYMETKIISHNSKNYGDVSA
ncbi:hypothetical protein LguiB_005624 [Lonicera macranthoides]